MTTTTPTVLVLGGTGKTGSTVAARLARRGDVAVRTAAPDGADVPFSWQDPATYMLALHGVDRIYAMAPIEREAGLSTGSGSSSTPPPGVRHVTYLSAYGMDKAPPQVVPKAVELELMGRGDLSYAIVRPAWFMQNFTDGFLMPVDGLITVPTGEGTEVFVDVADIAAVAAVAAATLADPGGEATASSDDISTPEGAASLVKAAADTYGTLDILINNAAVGRFTTMAETTIDEYELVRRVGLDGTYYVTREAWPIFAAKQYGRIVITTSGNGLLGNPASISYSIAKGGVFGLIRSAAIDGASAGIKVNSIGPVAATPMAEQYVSPEQAAALRAEFPTSAVSPIVAVLASRDCPATGEHLDVGGGHVGTTFLASTPGYFERGMTPESLLAHWDDVLDHSEYKIYTSGYESIEMVQITCERAGQA